MDAQMLVHSNAFLNAVSVVFLALGYAAIKSGDRRRHKKMMLSALAASGLFLISYVIYKLNSGFAQFGGEGIIRPIYFTLLIIHVIGAIAIVPLVPITVFRALTERFDRHRKIARITWPIWMFVGISGVVVYVMAVHMYPVAGA
jgi:putative membrane protein